MAALTRATELKPASVFVWNAPGAAYRHNGDPAMATAAYDRAIGIAQNVVSFVGLAAIARDAADHSRAEKLYSAVLRSDKRNAFALNGLGGVYVDLQRFAEAEACFHAAMQAGHENVVTEELRILKTAYENRGDIAATERIARWLAGFD